MSIAEGIYVLKYDMSYVTGGKRGERVFLQHIGIAPPSESQKFRAVYDGDKDAYCFLQTTPCDSDDNEIVNGLSFKDAEDRTAIIIGDPRHFNVVVEIFGGTERFGLTIGGGYTEKFAVGLAPEKILPERLELLRSDQVVYFEFSKVG